MKYDAWNQYPDLYSKDNTKYTFYHDDRTKVTYIAGVDGMTEEWIAQIREAHRAEVNGDRRGRSKGEGRNKLLSLSEFDELDDKSAVLIDPDADTEGNYIAGEERTEQSVRLKAAMESLTEEQRELLIRIRVNHESTSAIAHELSVDKSAISHRFESIEKKLKKFLK